jgi:hypothetical protein
MKNEKLLLIPCDVFLVIRDYVMYPVDVLYEDSICKAQKSLLSNWNDFTACCRSLRVIRRSTVYFCLNADVSIGYIRDEYISYRINSKILDSSEQVSLSLSLIYCRFLFSNPAEYLKLVHKVSVRCNNEIVNPSSLSFLSGVPVVHITGLYGITEDHLSMFSDSTTVNLTSCKSSGDGQMVDLHVLSSVKCVGFEECPFIGNISCFANCQIVHLMSLTKVTDVSSLSNVRTVKISYCENIKDVSHFKYVHCLKVEQSFIKLEGMSNLLNLYELDLRGSPAVRLPDFPASHPLRRLTVHFCHVPMLSQVKNKNVVVTCLGGYSSAPTLADFLNLNLVFFDLRGLSLFQVKHLTLTNCNNVLSDDLQFSYLETISFSHCELMCSNIGNCPRLKHVTFNSVKFYGVLTIDGTSLHTVFLEGCTSLHRLRICVKLHYLTLRNVFISSADLFEKTCVNTVVELNHVPTFMKIDQTCQIVKLSVYNKT